MMDRTTRPLVIVAAFAGSLRGRPGADAVGAGRAAERDRAGRHRRAVPADRPGRPDRTEKNLQGRPTLIFFGFTHCPDVCPTSLFEISEVLRAMGKDADRVNAYFISVDPERDTTAAMKDYLSSFDPHLKGLTGNPDAGRQGDVRLPGLCQEGPAQGRRLHHGSHRADLSDGSRRQIRRRRSTSSGRPRQPRPI